MSAVLVRASGLSRRFDERIAVSDLSFTLGAGEILALLGPNGAGKTTTFRVLAGLLLPTAGTVTIAGEPLTRGTADAVRGHVGLLTEAPGLWERLTVRQNLQTFAELHDVEQPRERVDEIMRAVGVSSRAEDRAGALSKGLKQRVAIARALIHDPSVVLLDEPTAGLDPESAREVRDLVRTLREQGRAVMVSTHNLAEAEDLADRIAVMNTRLLALDTPRSLRERRRGGRVVVEIEGGATPWVDLAARDGRHVIEVDGDRMIVAIDAAHTIPDLITRLAGAGARILRVTPDERSLEETYLELVRQDGSRGCGRAGEP
jgi:ABC-2 type transport system ATP-binding protein